MSDKILIVDDDDNLRHTLREVLETAGYEVRDAENGRKALAQLDQEHCDAILCDWKMPEQGGEELLRALMTRDQAEHLPVIIMTAHGTGPNAITAMQLGAYDFVTKPFDIDEVLATVRRALQHVRLQREVERLRKRDQGALAANEDTEHRLVGTSRGMLEVFKAIGRVAKTDVTVLLLGETGTGKELAARTIHESSFRGDRPFVVVNCAALPAELLESELFGHERGSFTGAIQRKLGKFESAAGGTIFLDEIGELPLALQPKLLRVLQEHAFERIGGTESIHADFRVIAATNRVLEEEVGEKQFRPDLYYRLKAFSIQLPALREHRSDILPLAEYFLMRFNLQNQQHVPGFTEDAIVALQQYSYPGNIRELEHIVERAGVQAAGRAITREIAHQALPALEPGPLGSSLTGLSRLPFHASVSAWEKHLIENALAESGGNKTEAARKLQIHRRLLYEKMEQLGIDKESAGE
jgi:DNA-binding NtrC family response regulator